MVWPELSEIRIWSPNADHAARLADASEGARAVPIEEAAAAEVVLTVTVAVDPVLKGAWLGAGCAAFWQSARPGTGPANSTTP